MATFQQAVEKLSHVFESLQSAMRGPARSPWAFSQIGRYTQNTFQGSLWQNPGFGIGLGKQITSDAIKKAVATGGDPMQLLGQAADRASTQMFLTQRGGKNDYFGGLNIKSGAFLRSGTETKAERDAYTASTVQAKMAAGIGEAERAGDVAFRLHQAAETAFGKNQLGQKVALPINVNREAIQSMQEAHGRMRNYFDNIKPGLGVDSDELIKAEGPLNRFGRMLDGLATSGKAFGQELRTDGIEPLKELEAIQRRVYSSVNTHMTGMETPEPSKAWRFGRNVALAPQAIGRGVGGYFRSAGADLRAGNIDWRAMHALTGFGFGALAAAGGPGMSTLSGSAQLAMGSFGRGLNGPSAVASRILQGAGGWADRHPVARDALGWTVAAGGASLLGIGALSRLKTGARTIAGAVNNGLTYFTSLGAGASSAAARGLGSLGTSTGAAGAGLTTGLAAAAPFAATVAGTAYLPIKAGWNLMEEESLSKRYAMSQTSTGGERLNPLESMAKFLFGPSTKDQIAKRQESKDKNDRDLAISFGNLFQGGGAVPGDTDLRGYISSKANMSPLDLEQMMSEFRSMVDYLEKLSGSSKQTNDLLERMTVGNRPG